MIPQRRGRHVISSHAPSPITSMSMVIRVRCASDDVFGSARDRVDAFLAENFSFSGTLRLHRHAIGRDLLRSPVNVTLAPLHLAARLISLLFGCIGLRRLAVWVASRDVLLRTAISRELEGRLIQNLFGFAPLGQGVPPTAHALLEAQALLLGPHLLPEPREAELRARRAAASIAAYSGVRSAVAEITTAATALFLGALAFRSLTPGMVSLAPTLAEGVVREVAVHSFPLGITAGSAWYALFPAQASAAQVLLTAAALIVIGSCIATFSGLIADPLQAHLGIHRRRLLRLIDAVESDLTSSSPKPFSAREHYYARFADCIDAATAVFRSLR